MQRALMLAIFMSLSATEVAAQASRFDPAPAPTNADVGSATWGPFASMVGSWWVEDKPGITRMHRMYWTTEGSLIWCSYEPGSQVGQKETYQRYSTLGDGSLSEERFYGTSESPTFRVVQIDNSVMLREQYGEMQKWELINSDTLQISPKAPVGEDDLLLVRRIPSGRVDAVRRLLLTNRILSDPAEQLQISLDSIFAGTEQVLPFGGPVAQPRWEGCNHRE